MDHATPNATQSFADRFKQLKFNILGSTNLKCSALGFGGYRIDDEEPEHALALKKALLSGINLIDTSTNYMNGRSEILIGRVLNDLIKQNKIKREEVIVVTKIGYIQSSLLKEAKEKKQESSLWPEVSEYQENCWYCISPEFIEDQVERSLKRLKIEKIDFLLLHNPEYILKTNTDRQEFDLKIQKAFECLENLVKNGRIQYYGISSNSFVEDLNAPDHVSFSKCLDIAEKITSQHHFKLIQFPFNLYETGALELGDALLGKNKHSKTEEKKLSLFQQASVKNIGCLVNRPFNAFRKNQLVRLTHFPIYEESEIKTRLYQALDRVLKLEGEQQLLAQNLGFIWGQALRKNMHELDDILKWRETLNYQILPSLSQSLKRVDERHQKWADEYKIASLELLSLLTKKLESQASQKSQIFLQQLQELEPKLKPLSSLSQAVLSIYTAFSGLSSVLVGARQEAYVEDILGRLECISENESLNLIRKFQ